MEANAVPRKDLSRAKRKRTKSTSSVPLKKTTETSVAATAAAALPSTDVFDFNTVDYESLVASLTDNAMDELPTPSLPTVSIIPPLASTSNSNNYTTTSTNGGTQVQYYTCELASNQPTRYTISAAAAAESPESTHPRLLLRQAYKLANEACVVVGLESTEDYATSIYLVVAGHTSVKLTIEDILSLNSAGVSGCVDKYLLLENQSTSFLSPIYLDSIVIEQSSDKSNICFTNYRIRPKLNHNSCSYTPTQSYYMQSRANVPPQNQIIRQTSSVVLSNVGWSYLKRVLDCVQSYYKLCEELSPLVDNLVNRYTTFFTRHYRPRATLLFNGLKASTGLVRLINSELPSFMQCELNASRLPASNDYNNCEGDDWKQWELPRQHQYYESTPLRTAMLPWVDSEVRRYCISNVIENVLKRL